MCDTEQMVVDNSELSMWIKVIDALSPIKKCDVIIRNYGNGEPTQVGTGDVTNSEQSSETAGSFQRYLGVNNNCNIMVSHQYPSLIRTSWPSTVASYCVK